MTNRRNSFHLLWKIEKISLNWLKNALDRKKVLFFVKIKPIKPRFRKCMCLTYTKTEKKK